MSLVPYVASVQQVSSISSPLYSSLSSPSEDFDRAMQTIPYAFVYRDFIKNLLAINEVGTDILNPEYLNDISDMLNDISVVISESEEISLKPHRDNIMFLIANIPAEYYDPTTRRLIKTISRVNDQLPAQFDWTTVGGTVAGSAVVGGAAYSQIGKYNTAIVRVQQAMASAIEFATTQSSVRSQMLGTTPSQHLFRQMGRNPVGATKVGLLAASFTAMAGIAKDTAMTLLIGKDQPQIVSSSVSGKIGGFTLPADIATSRFDMQKMMNSLGPVSSVSNPMNYDLQHQFLTPKQRFPGVAWAGNVSGSGTTEITETQEKPEIRFSSHIKPSGVPQEVWEKRSYHVSIPGAELVKKKQKKGNILEESSKALKFIRSLEDKQIMSARSILALDSASEPLKIYDKGWVILFDLVKPESTEEEGKPFILKESKWKISGFEQPNVDDLEIRRIETETEEEEEEDVPAAQYAEKPEGVTTQQWDKKSFSVSAIGNDFESEAYTPYTGERADLLNPLNNKESIISGTTKFGKYLIDWREKTARVPNKGDEISFYDNNRIYDLIRINNTPSKNISFRLMDIRIPTDADKGIREIELKKIAETAKESLEKESSSPARKRKPAQEDLKIAIQGLSNMRNALTTKLEEIIKQSGDETDSEKRFDLNEAAKELNKKQREIGKQIEDYVEAHEKSMTEKQLSALRMNRNRYADFKTLGDAMEVADAETKLLIKKATAERIHKGKIFRTNEALSVPFEKIDKAMTKYVKALKSDKNKPELFKDVQESIKRALSTFKTEYIEEEEIEGSEIFHDQRDKLIRDTEMLLKHINQASTESQDTLNQQLEDEIMDIGKNIAASKSTSENEKRIMNLLLRIAKRDIKNKIDPYQWTTSAQVLRSTAAYTGSHKIINNGNSYSFSYTGR